MTTRDSYSSIPQHHLHAMPHPRVVLPKQHEQATYHAPSWPAWLAWGLCGVTLVYMLLLFTVHDPTAPNTIRLRLIYPGTMLGTVTILLAAGWEQGGKRRWAWVCQAVGMFIGGVLAEGIQITAYMRSEWTVNPLTEQLYVIAYIPAIVGCALYLERRTGWVGNALRIILDSIAIGCCALVLMQSFLPLIFPKWPWTDTAIDGLTLVALDVALLFIVSIMTLRYRRGGGPLLVLASMCFICLLLADSLRVYLSWVPGGYRWSFAADPLYLLHSICLALGAYRSVQQPPQLPSPTLEAMPIGEWLLWTKIPRVLLLVVVGVVISGITVINETVWFLLIVSVIRDILATWDQRRVLHDLHAAERLARESKAQVDQTSAQTKDFLDRIIHDLGAPAHGLQTGFRHLEGDPVITSIIRMQVDHLCHLVEQLRNYQRARHFQATLAVLEVIELAPICFAAVDAIQDRADMCGIHVQIDLEEMALYVVADRSALRRILDNLLANALTATEPHGEITVHACQTSAAKIRIEVIDTGCGIPSEQHTRIFTPMVRLWDIGTGLGLATAQELVKAMRGTIGVHSVVGQGSTFWIELPVPPHG